MEKECQFVSVYDRLDWKAKNGVTSLTSEEREALKDILLDSFASTELMYSDENLISLAVERGNL